MIECATVATAQLLPCNLLLLACTYAMFATHVIMANVMGLVPAAVLLCDVADGANPLEQVCATCVTKPYATWRRSPPPTGSRVPGRHAINSSTTPLVDWTPMLAYKCDAIVPQPLL